MANATTSRAINRQEGLLVSYEGNSGEKYYAGTLIEMSGVTTGLITSASQGDTNSYFLGVMNNQADLTGGLGESYSDLEIWKEGIFTFDANGTGSTTHIGLPVYAIDDQTVGTSAASPKLAVGVVTSLESTSKYRVRITNYVDKIST